MNDSSANCKDSCKCKEWVDTDLKRARNEVTISSVNSDISRSRTNIFTDFAALRSCDQSFAKFPWRAQWKQRQ